VTIWNKFASKHENIFMVLSGHMSADTVVIKQRKGEAGNTVTEMLIDPQTMDGQYAGGTGPLREVDWEFGILPTPLYDENQEEYITLLGNPITLWCVMANAKDPQMSTAVLECMASEAYRKTSPALFENNMKYRYTPDVAGKGDGARMFDIIRTNINFDLGRLFSDSLSYMSEMPSDAAANRTSWATIMKQQKVALTRAMKTLNTSLEKIVG
jgi:hypothetical protein